MNVVSYSVWGELDSLYVRGAIKNALLVHKFYPGWIPRFYVPNGIDMKIRDALRDAGGQCVVVCDSDKVDPWFGLYWRFGPMFDDPDVERFIVRDTDSRISPREVDAVAEWVESGIPFHIMRDNPCHNVPILGGMWGAVPGCVPGFKENMAKWVQSVSGNNSNPRGRLHGTDQDFLKMHVWPYIKHSHIAHGIPFEGNVRPFRVENPDGYRVGIFSV